MENRLRVLRAEHDWSQQDLAEKLEVSRQSVNAIETGRYDPSLPLAFGLARVFYRAVTTHDFPSATNLAPTNVILTGHSLGGALAGFVGARGGVTVTLYLTPILLHNPPMSITLPLRPHPWAGTRNSMSPNFSRWRGTRNTVSPVA